MSWLSTFVHALLRFFFPAPLVDVTGRLDTLAAGRGQRLDWPNSIVDLLKAIGHDSSLGARKDMAREYGYQGTLNGSAAMNIWLHAEVMRRLSNGTLALPPQ